MGLEAYRRKRDFARTPEPQGKAAAAGRHGFVVQEHHASKLHFDFRLEMGGVLKSWSVPKGPSLDPTVKRLAVPTEDHPVEYLKFEGRIPDGQYGAGEHMIWDAGTYELLDEEADPIAAFDAGKLSFRLRGKKLRGAFTLVRMEGRGGQWLLIKGRDEYAEPGWQLALRMDTDEKSRVWRRGIEKERQTTLGAGKSGARAGSGSKGGVRKTGSPHGRAKAVLAGRAFKVRRLDGDLLVKVGPHAVALTNLDKLYWPDDGYTKGDLIRYYYEIADHILPYLKDRPLIMKRYPEGIAGGSFHQHDVDEAPTYVRTVSLDVVEGHAVDYIVGDNLATLLYMANLGAIECHPWHSRTRNLDRPDWLVFDLDPGEGVAFGTVCEVALGVRDLLGRLGLDCYAKTSGSRGIHVYLPLKPMHGYDEVAGFAARVAALVAGEHPRAATVERSLKKRRPGQIYVDHLQNARGKSVVAPYSVRPRPGATISAPLDWREVARGKVTPEDFTIKNILRRVARKGDIFRPVLSRRQTLGKALSLIENGKGAAGVQGS